MLTFQDQVEMAQQITGDTSSALAVIFKRDINEGGAMFLNRLGRKFNREYITADLTADQQYYQLPSSVLRISDVRCLHGTFYYSPELVTSEEEWNRMNAIVVSGNHPTHVFVRGRNEIGLFPIPSTTVDDGLSVAHEPQHVELTQDDFTDGTVTVASGDTTVTHSGTGFTPNMVGRWLQVTDSSDGKWYRITSYTSTSVLELENYYEGIAGSGRSFRIGEAMKLPEAYQDAPVFYALDRYYLTQGDQATATMYKQRFNEKIRSAKETYGRSTSHMGVKTRGFNRRPTWIDLTPPVTYP